MSRESSPVKLVVKPMPNCWSNPTASEVVSPSTAPMAASRVKEADVVSEKPPSEKLSSKSSTKPSPPARSWLEDEKLSKDFKSTSTSPSE